MTAPPPGRVAGLRLIPQLVRQHHGQQVHRILFLPQHRQLQDVDQRVPNS